MADRTTETKEQTHRGRGHPSNVSIHQVLSCIGQLDYKRERPTISLVAKKLGLSDTGLKTKFKEEMEQITQKIQEVNTLRQTHINSLPKKKRKWKKKEEKPAPKNERSEGQQMAGKGHGKKRSMLDVWRVVTEHDAMDPQNLSITHVRKKLCMGHGKFQQTFRPQMKAIKTMINGRNSLLRSQKKQAKQEAKKLAKEKLMQDTQLERALVMKEIKYMNSTRDPKTAEADMEQFLIAAEERRRPDAVDISGEGEAPAILTFSEGPTGPFRLRSILYNDPCCKKRLQLMPDDVAEMKLPKDFFDALVHLYRKLGVRTTGEWNKPQQNGGETFVHQRYYQPQSLDSFCRFLKTEFIHLPGYDKFLNALKEFLTTTRINNQNQEQHYKAEHIQVIYAGFYEVQDSPKKTNFHQDLKSDGGNPMQCAIVIPLILPNEMLKEFAELRFKTMNGRDKAPEEFLYKFRRYTALLYRSDVRQGTSKNPTEFGKRAMLRIMVGCYPDYYKGTKSPRMAVDNSPLPAVISSSKHQFISNMSNEKLNDFLQEQIGWLNAKTTATTTTRASANADTEV